VRRRQPRCAAGREPDRSTRDANRRYSCATTCASPRGVYGPDGPAAFAQLGVVHQSDSLASTDPSTVDLQGNSTYYDLPGFTTYEAALGVERDGWRVQLYGQNLTDTRADLYANYSLFYKAVTVNRPRTIGLRVSYKFKS
jgi:outer membrane receptor protein involved in Fe transport